MWYYMYTNAYRKIIYNMQLGTLLHNRLIVENICGQFYVYSNATAYNLFITVVENNKLKDIILKSIAQNIYEMMYFYHGKSKGTFYVFPISWLAILTEPLLTITSKCPMFSVLVYYLAPFCCDRGNSI